MRPSLPLIFAALLSAGTVAGCGLKDDLYLPPQPTGTEAEDDQLQDDDARDVESSRT